jgi:DNA polymerase/3'-5' exonuclease PolX
VSNKKSYMDKSNLINEGIFAKILDLLKKGKIKKLQKAFRKQPEIQKKINQINKSGMEIEKWYKDYTGEDFPKGYYIK